MAYPIISPVFSDSILKMNQRVSAIPPPDTDPQAPPQMPPQLPDPVNILLQQRIAERMGCTLAYSTGLPSGSLTALVPVMKLHSHYVPVCIEYLGEDNYQCHGFVSQQEVVCQFNARSDAQAFFIAIYFHRETRRPDFRIEDLIPGMPALPAGAADYDSQLEAVRAIFDTASAHHAQARTTVQDLLDEWNFKEHGAIGPFVGFQLARRMPIQDLDQAFVGSEIRAAIEALRAQRPGPYPFLWLDYCQALLDHHTPLDAHAEFLACETLYRQHDGKKWEAHVAAAWRMAKVHVQRILLLADPDGNLKLRHGHEHNLPSDFEFLRLVTYQFANEWCIDDGPVILFIQYRLEQQYPEKWAMTNHVSKQINQAIGARELREAGDYPHQWIHFYYTMVRKHGGTVEADRAMVPFEAHYTRYKGAGKWTTMALALRNTYLRNQRNALAQRAVPGLVRMVAPVEEPAPAGRKLGSGRPRKRPAPADAVLLPAVRPASKQRRSDDPPSE